MCSKKLKYSIVLSAVAAVWIIVGLAKGIANIDASELQLSEPPKNVILITISTLRADHVSCLGFERDTTPNFDNFGEENILFRNAFATSGWMMPAHGSIFTSLYPSLHGATHINKSLGDKHYTLAEILSDNGYYCVGFCCNPRLDQEYGFAQGFDIYDDYSVSMILQSLILGNEGTFDINKQRTNALINDSAIGWLQSNTHKPFFMFIHYYDNHWDYLPPSPYYNLYDPDYDGPIDGTEIAREPLFSNPPGEKDIQHIIALYDGEVKQTDNDLGEMLKVLKDRRVFDNSIVIILGDHGEQFYEHGHTSHHGVFEELIHIPLAVSIPGTQAKGKIVDSLVSQMDILPTVLDYLQIPAPEQCQGKSLKPVIEGQIGAVNEFVFAEYTGGAAPDSWAVRSARYKYYQMFDIEPFAYDLVKDPKEQNNILLDNFSEDVRVLQKHLEKLMLK